jgi:DtxR family Mn-dependent transcriptional regulator
MIISFTEENYVKAIFHFQQVGKVNTTMLSQHFGLKAASVTEMLKRLSDKKLIDYQKYKPVYLTKSGNKLALSIIRLNFKWNEVHEIAEQLEHIKSEELINRLEKYLDHPKFDPHGDPIPNKNGSIPKRQAILLNQVVYPGNYKLVAVNYHTNEFLQHLTKLKLNIGNTFKIEERSSFDGSYRVKLSNNFIVLLSNQVATHLLVKKV